MKYSRVSIAYGKGSLGFSLPKGQLAGVLQKRTPSRGSAISIMEKALSGPLSAGRLNDITEGKKRVLIVAPDVTRKAHLREFLPLVIKSLNRAVRNIDIIIATGLHKRHTAGQLRRLAGEFAANRCRVMSHGQTERELLDLGRTDSGIPVALNRKVKECDFLISIGLVEPHLYAGYSGGYKTVAIGLAGEETISATHSVKFLDDPLTRIGGIDRNPFQRALREIAGKASVGYAINIVNDPSGKPLAAFAGNISEVFKRSAGYAKDVFELTADKPSDIVICGIGYPKDGNLYQASRALNYVVHTSRPVLRKGGVLIVAAELADGVGDGISERRFFRELGRMVSPEHFIKGIKEGGCVAGEHRAYMVARVLKDYKVIFVSRREEPFMHGLPFRFCSGIRDALAYSYAFTGKNPRIYVIPHSLASIANSRR